MQLSGFRKIFLLLIVVDTCLGLATRKTPELFPPFIARYGGDTLWALLFFLIIRFIWPFKPLLHIALITYAFGLIIECSQLYQGEWIVQLRQTFAGQMLLGHGFLWSDLLCYAAGVLMGCLLDIFIQNALKRSKQ
jgi:hypothetical protein